MKNYTVKIITSFCECEDFVKSFCSDNVFSDPMLLNGEQLEYNLIRAIDKREDHSVLGIFKEHQMVGLVSFLTLKDEKYLEMLVGLSRDESAYGKMIEYIREYFSYCDADFVFNPNNYMLYDTLNKEGALFDTEQQTMIYNGSAFDIDTSGIEMLSEPYIASYLEMHSTDVYWTGEKIIDALDKFRVFVAIEDEKVVGYIDVTYSYEENEPFDFLVRSEYRRKGYGRKLLAKALEMNRPKGMVLHVDIDNDKSIPLYESMGFEKAENQNSLTAHLKNL